MTFTRVYETEWLFSQLDIKQLSEFLCVRLCCGALRFNVPSERVITSHTKKRKIKPNHWLHLFVNCSRFTPMKQRFTIHFNVMQNTLWVLFIFNFCCTVPIMYKSVWNLTDIIVFSRPQPPPPPPEPSSSSLLSVREQAVRSHTLSQLRFHFLKDDWMQIISCKSDIKTWSSFSALR